MSQQCIVTFSTTCLRNNHATTNIKKCRVLRNDISRSREIIFLKAGKYLQHMRGGGREEGDGGSPSSSFPNFSLFSFFSSDFFSNTPPFCLLNSELLLKYPTFLSSNLSPKALLKYPTFQSLSLSRHFVNMVCCGKSQDHSQSEMLSKVLIIFLSENCSNN